MSHVIVRPVETDAEMQAFLRMPWKVYADDPNWVAPLWQEHVHYFDPAHNVELRHIDLEKFVAWRGDQPVGTVIAFVNHAYNRFQEENAGWFGQWEVIEDEEAAHALLKAAEDWLRTQGVVKMLGPASFSSNSEWGLLIEGDDCPPMIMMRHDRAYARRFAESYGLAKAMDLLAWLIHRDEIGGKTPEKIFRVSEKIRQRRQITAHRVRMRDFDTWVERLKGIYNNAWEKNWGFIPLSDEEITHMQETLKPLVDPRVVVFIEQAGQWAAFGAPIVDLYEPLRYVRSQPGEPAWWQLARLLWHWKIRGRAKGLRVFLMGVLEEYRQKGLDGVIFAEIIQSAWDAGYERAELSWILESNDMMNRAIEVLGARVYKRYRVYEKVL